VLNYDEMITYFSQVRHEYLYKAEITGNVRHYYSYLNKAEALEVVINILKERKKKYGER
jgi:hypothetical protein